MVSTESQERRQSCRGPKLMREMEHSSVIDTAYAGDTLGHSHWNWISTPLGPLGPRAIRSVRVPGVYEAGKTSPVMTCRKSSKTAALQVNPEEIAHACAAFQLWRK
ncbi:hypothetical protein CERSUDRAFT_115753 [Gelatoporia subvermispora B]|uniref:Uncharacterized protein n=1 Tax=Ceriporiopsis subvermispora (strain B) TaxID=914234 RepID=M2QFJ9_CERS8|nr:hypothetical protein CERSUDRAFT_115753 [Gelatoporia subvermispora B]